MMPNLRRCFVIMPIGDKASPVGDPLRVRYEAGVQLIEKVIEPACAENGLEPIRADELSRPGEIPEQVFRLLRDSPVVIADVTEGNPNVMYELGLRHSKDLLTLHIGETGTLPFDISSIRTIPFSRTAAGYIDLRDALSKALATGLRDGHDAVAATRVWYEEADEQLGTESAEPARPIEGEEPGFLELLAQMEEALPRVAETLNRLTGHSSELTTYMAQTTEEIERSDQSGGGSPGRLRIAVQLAQELASRADTYEDLAAEYEARLREIDPGVNFLISQLEEARENLGASAPEFIESVRTNARVSKDMATAMRANAEVMAGLGNVARPLREPSGRIARALGRIADASLVAENWDSRISRIDHG